MSNCTLCYDNGWVLESDLKTPAILALIPCPIPDCPKSGQPIALMSVNLGRFLHVAREPNTARSGVVMSLHGQRAVRTAKENIHR